MWEETNQEAAFNKEGHTLLGYILEPSDQAEARVENS